MILQNNSVSDDDHVHKYVEVDTIVAHGGGVNGVQMTSHEDKDFYLIGFDVELVVVDRIGNMMLFVEEDGNLYDTETFTHIAYLGAIRL